VSRAAPWVGLTVGAGALAAAALLLRRTFALAAEIRRYADDVEAATAGIVRATAAGEELTTLRARAAALRGLPETGEAARP
jgi:hypothetical protein